MKRKRVGGVTSSKGKYRVKRSSKSWAALPFPALLEIFKNLNDEDKISAGVTCKHWKNIFDSPVLWRTRKFEFGGYKITPSGENAVLFASALGKHVQDVTLTCRQMTSNTCVNMTNTLMTFLDLLSHSTLREFKLRKLELDFFWKHSYLKKTLSDRLISFVQTQRNLKVFEMTQIQINVPWGTNLLMSLGQTAGHTLEHLNIKDYFMGTIGDLEQYQSAIKLFTNLTHVSLNYSYMNENLIRWWTTTLENKLRHISIQTVHSEAYDHVIRNDVWSDLKTACPDISVSIEITGISRSTELIPILAKTMPVNELSFWTGLDSNSNVQISAALQHINNNYCHLLEKFHLELETHHDIVDDVLLSIIDHCRQLKSIRVKANISMEVLRRISDMAANPHMKFVSAIFCDPSENQLEEILALQERMRTFVERSGVNLEINDNLF